MPQYFEETDVDEDGEEVDDDGDTYNLFEYRGDDEQIMG